MGGGVEAVYPVKVMGRPSNLRLSLKLSHQGPEMLQNLNLQ